MRSHHVKRKNYLPGLVLTIVFWILAVFIFFAVPPTSAIVIGAFLLIFLIASFLTSSLILGNSRSGFFVILIILVLGLLKKTDMLNIFSGVIVVAVLFTFNLLVKK